MTPEEFISTAERLLKEPCVEADKRSAISRSYYGAFHASVQSLPPQFAPTKDAVNSGESHKAVIDALASWGSSRLKGCTDAAQASRKLASLKRARRRADYEIAKDLEQSDLASCILNSRKVVELVKYARQRFDQTETSPA
jgi:uncharacterized protein (UPF0332 family)